MENETVLFHGSNCGLEVLGLNLDTGEPLESRGIYQDGLDSGLETSMTTNPRYAIHWGYDVLVVSTLERIRNCQTISNLYQTGTTYTFQGSLPSGQIMALFLDSLLLSFIPQGFLEKVRKQFPSTKVYPYAPDIHKVDGNMPYDLFQKLR